MTQYNATDSSARVGCGKFEFLVRVVEIVWNTDEAMDGGMFEQRSSVHPRDCGGGRRVKDGEQR